MMANENGNLSQALSQAAQAYGANVGVLSNIARLESGGNPNAINRTDSNAQAGHPSQGTFQFIPSTYQAFSKQAQAANPSAWQGVNRGNWLDPKAQALTTAWAITHGHQGDWSTYGRAVAAAHAGQGLGLSGSGVFAPAVTAAPQVNTAFQDKKNRDLENLNSLVFKNDPELMNTLNQHIESLPAPIVNHPAVAAAQASGGNVGHALVDAASQKVGETAIQAAREIKAQGVPFSNNEWCGEFVQSLFKAQGLNPPPAKYVPDLLKWAQAQGRTTKQGAAGNLALFDWNGDGVPDHVGIATGTGQYISGNSTGGGVTRHAIPQKNLLTYVRGA